MLQDELTAYEAGETFIQTLIVNLDGLLSSFKHCLTANNYDSLVATVTNDVTTRMERVILKSTFNRVRNEVFFISIRQSNNHFCIF